MASLQDRLNKLKTAKQWLNKLAPYDANSLARVDDLSKNINFSETVPYFQLMIDIVKQLEGRDIDRLPSTYLDNISTACTRLSALIDRVTGFDINQNTPADVCNNIIQNIKDAYDDVIEPLIGPLSFTSIQATDYAKIEREAKGYNSTMKEEHDSLLLFIEKAKGDATKALAAVQEQAAQAGVSTNAQIFNNDAKAHGDKAKTWFKATVVVSGVTLLLAAFLFTIGFFHTPETTPQAIQYIVNKLILLSALSFGIFWCARNYKAEKHNEILNQHRANALMTFRAFYEGTSESHVKDAILLQAAQAAFSPRPTGFDSQEKDGPLGSPLIEVIGKSIQKT